MDASDFDQDRFAEKLAEAIHRKQAITKNGGPYFAPEAPWYVKLAGLIAEKSIATLMACVAATAMGWIIFRSGQEFYVSWMIPFKEAHLQLVRSNKDNLEAQTKTLSELKEINSSILKQSRSNQETMQSLLETQPSQVLDAVREAMEEVRADHDRQEQALDKIHSKLETKDGKQLPQ